MSRKPEMEILARLDALYADPTRHAMYGWARDDSGAVTAMHGPTAYKFCFEAGIDFIARKLFGHTAEEARYATAAKAVVLARIAQLEPRPSSWLERLVRRLLGLKPRGYESIAQFNDKQGLGGVRAVLEELVHS